MLFGLVPLLVVLLGFRDRPSRYGLTLGDWRWGVGLMVVGCVVMTPIVLWFATLPTSGPTTRRARRRSATCSSPTRSS